jgi:hypothetical protein
MSAKAQAGAAAARALWHGDRSANGSAAKASRLVTNSSSPPWLLDNLPPNKPPPSPPPPPKTGKTGEEEEEEEEGDKDEVMVWVREAMREMGRGGVKAWAKQLHEYATFHLDYRPPASLTSRPPTNPYAKVPSPCSLSLLLSSPRPPASISFSNLSAMSVSAPLLISLLISLPICAFVFVCA